MSAFDPDRLEAFTDLECELADLVVMTDLVDDIVSNAFSNLKTHRDLAGGRPDLYFIPQSLLNRILFTARHANDMAEALEAKFLAILEGPREAGEEVRS
ncbi:hypothetical protein [Xanthobacter sediminis]